MTEWLHSHSLSYVTILLGHKKEQYCTICRIVDGPTDCHKEWCKSKREKQMSYNTIYMWDLEKCYRWTYLQSRNRETDVENKLTDTKGEGRVGWIGRWGLTHIHCYI